MVLGKEKAKSKIINNTLNPKAAQNRFSDVMYCICYLIGITPSVVKIDDKLLLIKILWKNGLGSSQCLRKTDLIAHWSLPILLISFSKFLFLKVFLLKGQFHETFRIWLRFRGDILMESSYCWFHGVIDTAESKTQKLLFSLFATAFFRGLESKIFNLM